MNMFASTSRWTLLHTALLSCIMIFQLIILFNRSGPQMSMPESRAPDVKATELAAHRQMEQASHLVAEAEAAFIGKSDDLAIALLSAALVSDPDNPHALDLYRDRLHSRFEAALGTLDWESAELQVAAYDSTIRGGLTGAATTDAVKSLVARQQEVRKWDSDLIAARDGYAKKEIAEIESQLSTVTAETLPSLDARLRQLPTDGLSDDIIESLARLALSLSRRDGELQADQVAQNLQTLEQSAQAPGISMNLLRTIYVKLEHLNADLIELNIRGVETTELAAKCQNAISELDRRLQVMSVRQMQTIADADAKSAIGDVESMLRELPAEHPDKFPPHYFQSLGQRLAEAELQLHHIDRLSSIDVQSQANQLLDSIRKQAISVRAQQTREYNLWAIGILEESIGDYKKAKGWFNDDEQAFMAAMEKKVGQIDPQHLHPVTHALFSEMFQKFLAELDSDQKVAVTRTIETAERRLLSDF